MDFICRPYGFYQPAVPTGLYFFSVRDFYGARAIEMKTHPFFSGMLSKALNLCLWVSVIFNFPAYAQEGVDWTRWSVSPGAGAMFVEGGQPVDGGAEAALRIGYDLSEFWTAEIGGSWAPYVKGAGGPGIYGASAEVLCHLSSYSRFIPYLAFGAGYYGSGEKVFRDGDAYGMAGPRAGFGMMYYLTEEIALRADARALMAVDSGCEMAYLVGVGLSFRLPERTVRDKELEAYLKQNADATGKR